MAKQSVAERSAYQRGFRAGSKKRLMQEREAFEQQVFLTLLPTVVSSSWVQGEKQLKSINDKVGVAITGAKHAAREFYG